ncbi:unnamed protein product [Rodentolepis nana]|uniref:MARVEL domain-containing protein n=1 Tax=Rodentolepis nana TaxID=102285 RepID=A0A0R3TQS1_RODNA|nr:unnamed protein product [Rodentolepis nana]
MTNENRHHKPSKCLFILFELLQVQQRHLCLGAAICCLSGSIIVTEYKMPSHFNAGYWMGTIDLVAALFMFVCAIKPKKVVSVTSTMVDAVAIAITFAGSFQLLVLKTGTASTTGWIGLVTCVFLIYHCVSCIYDIGACCNLKDPDDANAATTPTTNDNGRQVEEGGRGGRGRKRRTLSPPIDFRFPDEMPKLPGYEELGKSEGLPPDYNTLNVAPPEYTPTTEEVTVTVEAHS